VHCRLSDVVKGTAKPKSTNTKEKDNGVVVCTSPRAASPASPIPKAASVPEMKAQQPPPPPPPPPPIQQTSQVPLPVQAQSPVPPPCDREVKDVGTSSDLGLHAVSQTPPSSPDKYVHLCYIMCGNTKTPCVSSTAFSCGIILHFSIRFYYNTI